MAKKTRTPKPPRPVQAPQARVQAPQRRADRPAATGDKRRRNIIVGVVAALLVGAAVAVAVVLSSSGGSSSSSTARLGPAVNFASLPGLYTSGPPWPAESAQLANRLQILGLPALKQEALAFHIHQHLDVYVNGKPVAVPALVGIDRAGQFISVLHTHDVDGIIHVESPTKATYSLGQVMAEWGVKLTRRCLGGLCGKRVSVLVNGKPFVGDPARVPLESHDQIVIVYGARPSSIPGSYAFPADT